MSTVQPVYYQRVQDVKIFILAGGQSSRMGCDKSQLVLAGQTLLARSLALAGKVASNVAIVGDVAKFRAYAGVVEDVYPGSGPLAGIHAALAGTTAELNLMLAVDMPFVEIGFLQYLLAAAREYRAMITVPRASGRWQPLCAVYRREFAAVAQSALEAGRNRVDVLFAADKTRVIEEEELVRAGFSPAMFRNLNTPEDFSSAAEAFTNEKQPSKL